jgi:hypothetical protein
MIRCDDIFCDIRYSRSRKDVVFGNHRAVGTHHNFPRVIDEIRVVAKTFLLATNDPGYLAEVPAFASRCQN